MTAPPDPAPLPALDTMPLAFAVVLTIRFPFAVQQFTSAIPSLLILNQTHERSAANISAEYARIVATKTCINTGLRILFLSLLNLNLGGVTELPYRAVVAPIWCQFVVVVVILHTRVRELDDDMCTRDFKKQSAFVEFQLLMSLFIAMKLDNALHWMWIGVFWPIWIAVGIIIIVAVALTGFMTCMLSNIIQDPSRLNRNLYVAQPSLLAFTWISSVYIAIFSFLCLLRLSQYLDRQSEVPQFDAHLQRLLGFLACLEAYVTLFGQSALRRVAQQHQQQVLHQHAQAERQGAVETEEDRQAQLHAVMHGVKPKLLIKIGDDHYRRAREDEIAVLVDATPLPGEEEGEAGYVRVVDKREGQTAEEDGPQLCIVCWEQERETVLLECGHGCCCFDCARRVILGRQPCPMCRSPIQQCVLIRPCAAESASGLIRPPRDSCGARASSGELHSSSPEAAINGLHDTTVTQARYPSATSTEVLPMSTAGEAVLQGASSAWPESGHEGDADGEQRGMGGAEGGEGEEECVCSAAPPHHAWQSPPSGRLEVEFVAAQPLAVPLPSIEWAKTDRLRDKRAEGHPDGRDDELDDDTAGEGAGDGREDEDDVKGKEGPEGRGAEPTRDDAVRDAMP